MTRSHTSGSKAPHIAGIAPETRATARKSPVIRRGLLLIVVLLIVVGAVSAWALYSARHSLLSGEAELRTAQTRLQNVGSRASLRSDLAGVRTDVGRAGNDFRSADDHLSPLSPLLTHLSWIPRLGPEIAAAPALAHAARGTTDGTLSLLQGIGPLAALWDTSGGHKRTSALVVALTHGRADFDRAYTQFKDAQRTRLSVRGGSGLGALSTALHSFDSRLPGLLVLSRALALAPSFLGAHAPESYLVVYQNSDELRATGGFIGSASLVTVRSGRVSQLFQATGIVDNLSIPPPEPVYHYNTETGWLFRDSNWSPDFPTTAALERFFYKLDFHRDVPNVVDVTPQAASDILTAVGPLYLPLYHRTVNGANVAQLADYYAHWGPSPAATVQSSLGGKQFIGLVAQGIVRRLTSLSAHAWVQLGSAVGTASGRGDILFNFRNPEQQALVRTAGATHAVDPVHGDYLYVVNTNLSYNKINPYVHVQTSYGVHVRSTRWLDATLTVQIHNVPAPDRYLHVGIGPGAGALGGPDDYATFLRVYVPPGAALIDQGGWTQPWSQGPAYGGTMFSGYLIVRRGETRIVHLHYVVPPNVFSGSGGARYTLRVPHQPGSDTDSIRVSVTHDGTRSSWTAQHPVTEWSVSTPIKMRPFAPIPLPIVPPPAQAPGGWIEPHAYLAPPSAGG